jgi:hypothetical protein
MVRSPKTGRELRSECIDRAPSFVRRLLGDPGDATDEESDAD